MSYETNQPTTAVQVVIAIWVVIVALLALGYFLLKEPEPQTSSISTDECKVGHVNPDGSVTITEQSAGEYGYTIYATADGTPLVMGKCN